MGKIFVYRRGMTRADLSSSKSNSRVLTMSSNELAFAHLLEADQRVLRFVAQPATFKFAGMRYTPDFLAEYDDGTVVLWEIHSKKAMSKKLRAKFKLFAHEIERVANVRFCIFFNEDIDYNIVSNLRYLKKFSVSGEQLEELKTAASSLNDIVSVHEAEEHFERTIGPSASIRTLILNRIFACDLSQPIDRNTKVWRLSVEH